MSFIEWKEDMSVGLDALDDDHKVLIRIINSIESAGGDEARRSKVVAKALGDLTRYAAYHFEREEKVMKAGGYIELKNHKIAHGAFLSELGAVAGRFQKTPSSKNYSELLSYLTNWLVHHIMVQDRAYRPYVEDNRDAIKAAAAVDPMVYEPE